MLQIQETSLRPLTTAHLAQTMSLLVLSNRELRERVLEELNANPALELLEEPHCPSCGQPLNGLRRCLHCTAAPPDAEAIVFLSPWETARPCTAAPEEPLPDLEPSQPERLADHVLEQLTLDMTPDARQLALYILACLDDNGFLQDPPVLIAQATRCPLEEVHRVLELIHRADPPGLATPGPRQALLAQARLLAEENPLAALAARLLEEAFEDLAHGDFDGIARRLEVPRAEIRRAADFIRHHLFPYPARAFHARNRSRTAEGDVYYTPDVQISLPPGREDGPLVVEVFAPFAGRLRVNPLFRQAAVASNGSASEAWHAHLERASLFVKCLHQRGNTMRRLMALLAREQRAFILHGDLHLRPMTRAQVARKLDVHESTVSRAVANKAVALPDGRIIPLARFFDRSLPVRARIRRLVESETRPLTDEELTARLHKEGIKVARRTVAKYRSLEGILPARLRARVRRTALRARAAAQG